MTRVFAACCLVLLALSGYALATDLKPLKFRVGGVDLEGLYELYGHSAGVAGNLCKDHAFLRENTVPALAQLSKLKVHKEYANLMDFKRLDVHVYGQYQVSILQDSLSCSLQAACKGLPTATACIDQLCKAPLLAAACQAKPDCVERVRRNCVTSMVDNLYQIHGLTVTRLQYDAFVKAKRAKKLLAGSVTPRSTTAKGPGAARVAYLNSLISGAQTGYTEWLKSARQHKTAAALLPSSTAVQAMEAEAQVAVDARRTMLTEMKDVLAHAKQVAKRPDPPVPASRPPTLKRAASSPALGQAPAATTAATTATAATRPTLQRAASSPVIGTARTPAAKTPSVRFRSRRSARQQQRQLVSLRASAAAAATATASMQHVPTDGAEMTAVRERLKVSPSSFPAVVKTFLKPKMGIDSDVLPGAVRSALNRAWDEQVDFATLPPGMQPAMLGELAMRTPGWNIATAKAVMILTNHLQKEFPTLRRDVITPYFWNPSAATAAEIIALLPVAPAATADLVAFKRHFESSAPAELRAIIDAMFRPVDYAQVAKENTPVLVAVRENRATAPKLVREAVFKQLVKEATARSGSSPVAVTVAHFEAVVDGGDIVHLRTKLIDYLNLHQLKFNVVKRFPVHARVLYAHIIMKEIKVTPVVVADTEGYLSLARSGRVGVAGIHTPADMEYMHNMCFDLMAAKYEIERAKLVKAYEGDADALLEVSTKLADITNIEEGVSFEEQVGDFVRSTVVGYANSAAEDDLGGLPIGSIAVGSVAMLTEKDPKKRAEIAKKTAKNTVISVGDYALEAVSGVPWMTIANGAVDAGMAAANPEFKTAGERVTDVATTTVKGASFWVMVGGIACIIVGSIGSAAGGAGVPVLGAGIAMVTSGGTGTAITAGIKTVETTSEGIAYAAMYVGKTDDELRALGESFLHGRYRSADGQLDFSLEAGANGLPRDWRPPAVDLQPLVMAEIDNVLTDIAKSQIMLTKGNKEGRHTGGIQARLHALRLSHTALRQLLVALRANNMAFRELRADTQLVTGGHRPFRLLDDLELQTRVADIANPVQVTLTPDSWHDFDVHFSRHPANAESLVQAVMLGFRLVMTTYNPITDRATLQPSSPSDLARGTTGFSMTLTFDPLFELPPVLPREVTVTFEAVWAPAKLPTGNNPPHSAPAPQNKLPSMATGGVTPLNKFAGAATAVRIGQHRQLGMPQAVAVGAH